MQMPGTFFLHLLTPADIRSFSIQANHLNFGLAAFFFLLFPPELSYRKTFLLDGQFILIFLLILLLQYFIIKFQTQF